jgi:hypothetical protein
MKVKETRDENGQFHSFNDEPAYFEENFTQLWYSHGVIHRGKDLPAKILKNGQTLEWTFNGLRHRENGPALIKYDNPVAYNIFGGGHRLDGPAYSALPNWYFLYGHPFQIEEHKQILRTNQETGISLPLLVLGHIYDVEQETLKALVDLPFIWANKAVSLASNHVFDSDNTPKSLKCLKLAWATHNITVLN